MKQIEITVAHMTPKEATEEAEKFRVLLPGLARGCVFCAHDPATTPGYHPGTAYLRMGWTDGGPEMRAPPVYAPVCETCLEM